MSCNGHSRAAAYTQSAAEWANAFLEIFREKLSTSSAARGRFVAADAA
jgi:hypothetical protein